MCGGVFDPPVDVDIPACVSELRVPGISGGVVYVGGELGGLHIKVGLGRHKRHYVAMLLQFLPKWNILTNLI